MSRYPALAKVERIRMEILKESLDNNSMLTSEDYIRHNYAMVDVFFRSFAFEQIEWTEAMDIYQLVRSFYFNFQYEIK